MSELSSSEPISTTPAEPPRPVVPRRLRLWPAIVILVAGILRLCWIWLVWPIDTTVQTMHTYMTVMPMVLGLGLWWTFLSRVRWRVRLIGWGVVAVTVLIAGCFVRVDDVTGEVIPILAWRWAPVREEVAAAYFEKESAVPKPSPSAVAGAKLGRGPVPLKISNDDWPEYRGRLRDGIVRGGKIRTDWDAHPPQALWRHPVGLGWSAFIVVDGLAITQEQRREAEAVVCYDVLTGEQTWVSQDLARFSEALGGDGPRATPTAYDGRLFVLGATGILNCLEPRTGQKIWSRDVLVENSIPNIPWGMAGSPLVYDDVVVINAGGPNQQGLMAFDRITGQPKWQAGIDQASYCAPQLGTVDGVRQILLFDGAGIAGHDMKDGHQLWKFPWTNQAKVNASQPFIPTSDQVFISNGYGVGSAMLQVKHQGSDWTVAPLWESKKLRLKFNSGVMQDRYIYGLDEGILACFDLVEKKLKWKGGRYSFGQILLVDEWLIILAETGELVLVKAIPDKFEEVAKFQAINGKTWNNLAMWKGLLLIRNGDEAACYDLRPETRKH